MSAAFKHLHYTGDVPITEIQDHEKLVETWHLLRPSMRTQVMAEQMGGTQVTVQKPQS
jgi:hypothetical protein